MTTPGGGIASTDPAAASQPPVEAKNVIKPTAPGPAPAAPGTPQAEEAQSTDERAAETEGLTAEEERELGRLQEKAARAQAGGLEPVKLRVDPDGQHSELIFGGMRVTRDMSEVPGHLAAALRSAADDAGVKLIQED